jgi:hypothetical protein
MNKRSFTNATLSVPCVWCGLDVDRVAFVPLTLTRPKLLFSPSGERPAAGWSTHWNQWKPIKAGWTARVVV